MAAVSVFVDDAIRGDLPLVCAKTGEPADVLIRMCQPVGGGLPAAAWLLLLLGPMGIVILVVLALGWPGAEQLTVRIPETEASFARERQLERWRLAALGAGVFVPLYGALSNAVLPGLWLALGAAFLITAAALHVMVWRQSIGVSIDVTRRWVTFTGVHPAFVEAVNRQQAAPSRR
jgi:hypothetical protein